MANPLKLLKLKATGFQILQELPIDAPPERVWDALMNVGGWFKFADGSMQGEDTTFEPWPGGRFFGASPDGACALHGIVTHIEPNKLLRMSGPIGLTHLPVTNVFIWELQPERGGRGTRLRFAQRTFGFITADVKKNYPTGWKQLLGQLKELAEHSPATPKKKTPRSVGRNGEKLARRAALSSR